LITFEQVSSDVLIWSRLSKLLQTSLFGHVWASFFKVLIWSRLSKLLQSPYLITFEQASSNVLIWSRLSKLLQTSLFGHVWASFFKRPYLVTFEQARSPDSMICTTGCTYSFMNSWWWARWTVETCKVI
jgi:hypothetical protein